MAHYDIFREELAKKFYAYGHALWEPSPGELYPPVAIGDVGYIRRGKFHRIFNVLLPEDHPTHTNFGTPEHHEPLPLKMENHTDTGILSPNDFCSAEVRVVSGGLNIFSLRPEGSAQASFECSKRRGALLSIPVPARREDTVAQGQFAKWIIKHIDSWFSFAQSLGLGLEHMEEIVLVTGWHRTRSYTNILFSESRDGARVSFGVQVGSAGADITWEVAHEQIREVQIQRGPSGDNLDEDQCIFVRGFRATRFMGIFPTMIRGAAGPAPGLDSGSHSPPSDKQLMSTSIPESNTVEYFYQSSLQFIDVTKYQDPVNVLLRYIAEKEPDSDMFLVHDDDLACIGGAVFGSLQPDTLMDHLRNSQLKTKVNDCGYLVGPSQLPVKVGMLSERALGIFSPIPVTSSTDERWSGYRPTWGASSPATSSTDEHLLRTPPPSALINTTLVNHPMSSLHSPGSKPPDTPLLEPAQLPFNSIGSGGPTLYQRITPIPAHHGQAQHAQAQHAQPLQFTRSFLNDGYISYTFTPRMAEFYLVQLLFKVANSLAIQAIRDPNGSGAYFVFNQPSRLSTASLTINGRGTWLLDYDVRRGGSVVPQELCVPRGQGDRRRYVDQAQFRMPLFFVGIDGSLGVSVLNAAAGNIQLHGGHLPPPMQDKTTAKIRIAWPGYRASEQQVQLRDQTPARNPIALDRFVKHVGSRVQHHLAECENVPVQPFNWMVGKGNITSDEVMLIGIVQVSEGNWMPILQLQRRRVL